MWVNDRVLKDWLGRKNRALCLLVLNLSLLFVLVESRRAYAVVAEEVVLPLGVQKDGRSHDRLLAALREALRLTGATAADDRGLPASSRRCAERTCLLELATTHKASVFIGGTVEEPLGTLRGVRLWLFDARTLKSPDIREVGEEDELPKLIKEMAIRLIERHRSPPAESEPGLPTAIQTAPTLPGVGGAAAVPATLTAVSTDGKETSASAQERWRRRKILAGALFGVAAGSLAAAITLTVLAKQPRNDCVYHFLSPDCTVTTNFQPLYGGGYAVSGALVVAAILTLTSSR